MKKLKLSELNFEEILSHKELKEIVGGTSGSVRDLVRFGVRVRFGVPGPGTLR